MTKTKPDDLHIGMMGDGTEEQNLGQTGNPKARITKAEVEAAFGKAKAAKADREALVDENLEESFPARDPPSPKHIT